VLIRHGAGRPGADRGEAKSRSDQLLEQLRAAISATRRKGGLVGGPSEGGVDVAIEQKLKQSAGGAALLGALHNAWLRQHAPKWDGDLKGSPFANEGFGLDWVSDGEGSKKETKENIGKARAAIKTGISVYSAYLAGSVAVVLVFPELTYGVSMVSAWALLWPDFTGYGPQEDVFGTSGIVDVADPEGELPELGSLGNAFWTGMQHEIAAQIGGQWTQGGLEEDSSSRGHHGFRLLRPDLLEDLLGMQPGEWVWQEL
jgi:hypothetical protein